jgi:hypothetical protein
MPSRTEGYYELVPETEYGGGQENQTRYVDQARLKRLADDDELDPELFQRFATALMDESEPLPEAGLNLSEVGFSAKESWDIHLRGIGYGDGLLHPVLVNGLREHLELDEATQTWTVRDFQPNPVVERA